MSATGQIYAISTHCFQEYQATTEYDGTKFFLNNLDRFANFVQGEVEIYFPADSTASSLDAGKGILQTCTFMVGFGMAKIEVEYWSDEW